VKLILKAVADIQQFSRFMCNVQARIPPWIGLLLAAVVYPYPFDCSFLQMFSYSLRIYMLTFIIIYVKVTECFEYFAQSFPVDDFQLRAGDDNNGGLLKKTKMLTEDVKLILNAENFRFVSTVLYVQSRSNSFAAWTESYCRVVFSTTLPFSELIFI